MPGKILIVEDNSALSEIFAICLHNAGYETSWARNSAQGISKALAERPDLILTDLTLPDMTAVEAATILKKDPITSAIPIIVLTGIYGREWKTKALKAGAAEYMTKPVSLLHLTEVIGRLCPQPSVITEL
jgi:CheY-like chemotaxis protein